MCRFFPVNRLPSSPEGKNFFRGAEPKTKREGSAKPYLVVQFHPAPPPPFNPKARKKSGPTTTFKEQGKWTFYVFPNGVGEEEGADPGEETAPGGILERSLRLASQRPQIRSALRCGYLSFSLTGYLRPVEGRFLFLSGKRSNHRLFGLRQNDA
jgi:hypothetical protein